MSTITDTHSPERAYVDRCSECGVFHTDSGPDCDCEEHDAS